MKSKVTNAEHLASVAQNLERAMEALGLTKSELARSMDITLQKLGNWMRGDNYPDPYKLTLFCERFGVTMDFIYRGKISGLQKDVADGLAKAEQASPAASRVRKPRVLERIS